MAVTIIGTDSEQYHATLLNKDIQPATVIVYRDWMRQGLNPLNYGTKQTYKIIKLSFYVEDVSEDAVTDDISGLCAALQSCTLKFSDLSKYYDSDLADSSPISDTKIRPGVHQLDVTLQSGFAYLPAVSTALTHVTQVIANGNFASSSNNLATGFSLSGATAVSCTNNVQTFVATANAGGLTYTAPAGHRYFVSILMEASSNLAGIRYKNGSNPSVVIATHDGSSTYKQLYGIANIPSSGATLFLIADWSTSGWQNISVQNFMAIDMGTDASNPLYNLTADQMAAIVDQTGYFDGTKYLPITAQGNLPSPAIVTITPTQDIGSLTLTGLTKKPITVSNLHANAPVTIDGESCIVTEPDLDTIMTASMGTGKWMLRKYQVPNMFSPDTINASIVPDKSMITSGSAYTQQLISDALSLYQNSANNYLAHIKTGLYVASAKTITLKFLHDDGVNVLLNNTSVYSYAKAEDNNGNPGYPSVSLSLSAGWNRLEFLVLNHYGIGGIWGIQAALSAQVDQLNAYYARDPDLSGTVNKFPDCDMWSWPTISPGEQTVSVNSTVATVNISYKPKFL